jgi:hypothetical protein
MILVQKIGREQHKQMAQNFAASYVASGFGPKMIWNEQRHGWQGGIANTQQQIVAKEKAPFKLTIEQRLDRIERTLATLAKGLP